MSNPNDYTAKEVAEFVRYEPEGGRLFWRERGREHFASDHSHSTWNRLWRDRHADTAFNSRGYRIVRIMTKPYLAHRLIWAVQNGEWPSGVIDHIDGDCLNNRVGNLRDVSAFLNHRNVARKWAGDSGLVGIRATRFGRWTLRVAGKYRGSFASAEEAIAQRAKLWAMLGYTERHASEAFATRR